MKKLPVQFTSIIGTPTKTDHRTCFAQPAAQAALCSLHPFFIACCCCSIVLLLSVSSARVCTRTLRCIVSPAVSWNSRARTAQHRHIHWMQYTRDAGRQNRCCRQRFRSCPSSSTCSAAGRWQAG